MITRATLSLFLLSASTTFADTPDDQAKALYAQGVDHFAARDFTAAQNDFQRAYDLSHRKELLYNIALCHRERGELEPALESFRQYLAFAGPSGPNADQVRQQIADLERLVPAHLEVHSRGRAAKLTLDGQPSGKTPLQITLPGGTHTIVAEGAGPTDRLEVMLASGERKLVEVGHKDRTGMWIGIGIGAAVVVGVVVGVAVGVTRPPHYHDGTLDPGLIGVH